MSQDPKGFLMQWEWEFATTSRVIAALPPTSLGFRPHPKSKTAGELAWHIIGAEAWFVRGFLEGKMPEGPWPAMPGTVQAMIQAYALQHQDLADQVRRAPAEAWTRKVPFFDWEPIPGSVLLEDYLQKHAIHHRGQFTVYLRLTDAKVPAVYGPTADDAKTAR